MADEATKIAAAAEDIRANELVEIRAGGSMRIGYAVEDILAGQAVEIDFATGQIRKAANAVRGTKTEQS